MPAKKAAAKPAPAPAPAPAPEPVVSRCPASKLQSFYFPDSVSWPAQSEPEDDVGGWETVLDERKDRYVKTKAKKGAFALVPPPLRLFLSLN